jgi:hypothetical protein
MGLKILYIDMDNVLVDFPSGIARKLGTPPLGTPGQETPRWPWASPFGHSAYLNG